MTSLQRALFEQVERDHGQPDAAFRRRRVVAVVVLVVGSALLGVSLNRPPGSGSFYVLTLLVAATWIVGSVISGPLHLGYMAGRNTLRRPVVVPVVLGALAFTVFLVGALICREIPVLADLVRSILAFAYEGSLPVVVLITLLNGAAEEVFFRGGMYAGLGRSRPVLRSTVVYTLATVATLNPLLVFAAALMGTLFGLERRASGGLLAPLLTHVTWSVLMLTVLPPLFD